MSSKASLTFGERLEDLIEDKKTTKKEVAALLGVQPSRITALINREDTYPNSVQIIKLCRFFDVSSDYLLGLSDVKKLDTSTAAACNATGLSEQAAGIMKLFKEMGKSEHKEEKPAFGDVAMNVTNMLYETVIIDFERYAHLAAEARLKPAKRNSKPGEITPADEYELFKMKAVRLIDATVEKAIDEYCSKLKVAANRRKEDE